MCPICRSNLLYVIPRDKRNPAGIREMLVGHSEIRFVSLTAIDLRGNDIDERIPVNMFLGAAEQILTGGVQTDGSSVELPGIATLNNAKVDIMTDPNAKWVVDYNYDFLDPDNGLPVGTLRIPGFLAHEGVLVDSRALLARAVEASKQTVLGLLASRPDVCADMGFSPGDVEDVVFPTGTELEFWVKTPGEQADIEQLSASQVMKEQYWKRTKGDVRSALEESLIVLERYELEPEMGHKEVGGVKARVEGAGQLGHIMEQLEIDWKYANALEAADNEILARITVKETFRRHGLEVTFMAKPIEGVAGNGEHTHLDVRLNLKNGRGINLFTPSRLREDFLSVFGWGALMGILHNYEAVGALISCTNDAFNRLKPGFEAPVAIVASLGHSVALPSRNRSVLTGLIRDMGNPFATRFEVRSPNPHTNTYLAVAAFLQAMCHGMKYAVGSGKTTKQLEAEISKKPDEAADYLQQDRMYRSEADVFEHYTDEERVALFGKPPATVWETLKNLDKYPEKTAVLFDNDVFTPRLLNSYRLAMTTFWTYELLFRIIPEGVDLVRSCVKLHDDAAGNDLDVHNWADVQELRRELMQSSGNRPSLFSRIRTAVHKKDYEEVSCLQIALMAKTAELRERYAEYRRNLLEPRIPVAANGNGRLV